MVDGSLLPKPQPTPKLIFNHLDPILPLAHMGFGEEAGDPALGQLHTHRWYGVQPYTVCTTTRSPDYYPVVNTAGTCVQLLHRRDAGCTVYLTHLGIFRILFNGYVFCKLQSMCFVFRGTHSPYRWVNYLLSKSCVL